MRVTAEEVNKIAPLIPTLNKRDESAFDPDLVYSRMPRFFSKSTLSSSLTSRISMRFLTDVFTLYIQ